MRHIIPLASVMVILLLYACSEIDAEQENFFVVITNEALPDEGALLGRTILHGEIDAEVGNGAPLVNIDDHGFYWTTNYEALAQGQYAEVEIISKEIYDDDDFKLDSPVQEAGVTYHYQAFARSGERLMTGEIRSTTVNTLTTISYDGRKNDSISLSASILNLEGFIEDFGIIIGKGNADLTLENADWQERYILQATDQDINNMTTTIGRVDFNSTYYARTYYTTEETTYGEVIPIEVTDGWIQLADIPASLEDAAALSFSEEGYVFGGLMINGSISPNLYQFTPADMNESGSWNTVGSTTVPIYNGQFVRWNNQFYYGMAIGLFDQFRPWFASSNDLPVSPTCEGSVSPDRAIDGVAFVQNNKLYFGTGRFLNPEGYSNKFWEMSFDGTCYTVREIAPLPRMGMDMNETDQGRFGAITFEIAGTHYVGGGQDTFLQANDFYRFHPPANTTDLGEWRHIGFLPGEARDQAVAFGLNGNGYYGFGWSIDNGDLKDFHRFDTMSNTWTRTEPFPGPKRRKAFSFAIGDQGYIGGGFRKAISSNGNEIIPYFLQDFWTYIPAQ